MSQCLVIGQASKRKGCSKICTHYEIRTSIPCFIHITDGATHNVQDLSVLKYKTQGFYIQDRGYVEVAYYTITKNKGYFVFKAKDIFRFIKIRARNPNIKMAEPAPMRKSEMVLLKQILTRQCKVYKVYGHKNLSKNGFCEEQFWFQASNIALINEYRSKVEQFNKWIMQYLRGKSIWGNSQNIVKIDIYITIITFTWLL